MQANKESAIAAIGVVAQFWLPERAVDAMCVDLAEEWTHRDSVSENDVCDVLRGMGLPAYVLPMDQCLPELIYRRTLEHGWVTIGIWGCHSAPDDRVWSLFYISERGEQCLMDIWGSDPRGTGGYACRRHFAHVAVSVARFPKVMTTLHVVDVTDYPLHKGK